MIIEIIVLLLLVGSIAGFIFFIKHYFKASKARKENKQMLFAIEKAEDENACNDRYYRTIWNVLGDVNWGRIITFFIILGMALGAYALLNPALKSVSIGSAGNITLNQTAGTLNQNNPVTTFLSNAPWWIYILLIGLLIYIIIKIMGVRSTYFCF